MAILLRVNGQAPLLIDMLRAAGIPVQIATDTE
jgi:transglutaminase-like putative cysteine protease